MSIFNEQYLIENGKVRLFTKDEANKIISYVKEKLNNYDSIKKYLMNKEVSFPSKYFDSNNKPNNHGICILNFENVENADKKLIKDLVSDLNKEVIVSGVKFHIEKGPSQIGAKIQNAISGITNKASKAPDVISICINNPII